MYNIKRARKYEVLEETETVSLNPEHFRNIDISFDGENEQDFLDYLSDNTENIDEIYESLLENGFGETAVLLDKITDDNGKFEIKASTLNNGDSSYFKTT